MSQSVPDFSTVIVVISFLLVLGVVAFIVKKKSGHLKKIIKKENSFDVMHQMPLNNGFLAYVFKVDEEKFFFVGHKSGRGSLTQIDQPKFKTSNSNNKPVLRYLECLIFILGFFYKYMKISSPWY